MISVTRGNGNMNMNMNTNTKGSTSSTGSDTRSMHSTDSSGINLMMINVEPTLHELTSHKHNSNINIESKWGQFVSAVSNTLGLSVLSETSNRHAYIQLHHIDDDNVSNTTTTTTTVLDTWPIDISSSILCVEQLSSWFQLLPLTYRVTSSLEHPVAGQMSDISNTSGSGSGMDDVSNHTSSTTSSTTTTSTSRFADQYTQ